LTTIGFELRQLDKELSRLTRDRDRLGEAFEASADHRDLARIGAELAAAQAQLDDAEERWLTLATEAEASR
jgi:ATP-binding cassette subfamily F protein uup